MSLLLSPTTLGPLTLQNRMVMSPMTRSRAIGNIPNALMATYYGQRASAGLIVTEGIAPSPNGLGYARIPGLYSAAQTEGWKPVTEAVHAGGAKFIAQLMHTGRVSHPLNMPPGARVIAPSAVAAAGQMWTDQSQMQDLPVPEAMTTRSNSGERASVLKTRMSCAFTSSSPSTMARCSLRMSIQYVMPSEYKRWFSI